MADAPLLDREFLEKLERLTIHWQKSFAGLVGGHNISRFAGSGQEYGSAVAMSSSLIAVGAPRAGTGASADAGAVYVFEAPWRAPSDLPLSPVWGYLLDSQAISASPSSLVPKV